MSNPINDGGPAFPTPEVTNANGDVVQYASNGMPLRDWFAGQALIPILQDNQALAVVSKAMNIGSETAASLIAYNLADAMLAAREKGEK